MGITCNALRLSVKREWLHNPMAHTPSWQANGCSSCKEISHHMWIPKDRLHKSSLLFLILSQIKWSIPTRHVLSIMLPEDKATEWRQRYWRLLQVREKGIDFSKNSTKSRGREKGNNKEQMVRHQLTFVLLTYICRKMPQAAFIMPIQVARWGCPPFWRPCLSDRKSE